MKNWVAEGIASDINDFTLHQLKILALNEELQTVDGKQYTDLSASNYSKFEFKVKLVNKFTQ